MLACSDQHQHLSHGCLCIVVQQSKARYIRLLRISKLLCDRLLPVPSTEVNQLRVLVHCRLLYHLYRGASYLFCCFCSSSVVFKLKLQCFIAQVFLQLHFFPDANLLKAFVKGKFLPCFLSSIVFN